MRRVPVGAAEAADDEAVRCLAAASEADREDEQYHLARAAVWAELATGRSIRERGQ